MGHHFTFHGLALVARASGVLWWPEGRWLIVADLHLGKSERMARRSGTLLPPYESVATLSRLADEVDLLCPERVVSLGDAFDDTAAAAGLAPEVTTMIDALAAGRDWVWIGGNHDPDMPPTLPGRGLGSLMLGRVTLRHAAVRGEGPGISGHFHPVVRLAGERRRAFLIGADHLLLPAFGAYTGGLHSDHAAVRAIVPRGMAVACGARTIILPILPDRPIGR